jgi:outer membrane protein assembly factor BamB
MLPASDQAVAATWSQFRANSRLTGVAGDTPASTLILRWTYEAGGSIESSVAIVDGVVYVGARGSSRPLARRSADYQALLCIL